MLVAKSNEITRRRTEMSLSKPELAKKAGLPRNSLYRIEASAYSFTYPIRAKAIAKVLKCKVSDIFEEI